MSTPTEPPPLATPAGPFRPEAARRVALGLVLFGCVELAQGVGNIVFAFKIQSGHVSLNGLVTWIAPVVAAVLVWKSKRVMWPLLCYFAAMGLGLVVGVLAALLAGLPPKLTVSLMNGEPRWFSFHAGYSLLCVGFLAWLHRETRAVLTAHQFKLPDCRWLRPLACGAYTLAVGALLVTAFIALLRGDLTRDAAERARAVAGSSYDYQVLNYHFSSHNGHATRRATVLAYDGNKVRQLRLNWED